MLETLSTAWRQAVVVQLPIGAEVEFKGMIDLSRMKGVVWEDEDARARNSTTSKFRPT